MIPRRGRVGRQRQQIRCVVARRSFRLIRIKIGVQHLRQHDHAVEIDVRIRLQHIDQNGGAGRSVTLSEQISGGVPAPVFRQERGDEVGEGVRVLIDAVERFLLVLSGDPAEPGARRVDEHQIAGVQQTLVVVNDPVRCRRGMTGVGGIDAPRPESPHVQPHRRRAGTAVEQEGHRPRRWLGVPLQIRDVKHGRLRRPRSSRCRRSRPSYFPSAPRRPSLSGGPPTCPPPRSSPPSRRRR